MSYKCCKVIISDTEPEASVVELEGGEILQLGVYGLDLGFLWFKPNPGQFYQVASTDPLTWRAANLSGDLGNINFTGSIEVDGEDGITGSKTLGGHQITFRKGILTGFVAV